MRTFRIGLIGVCLFLAGLASGHVLFSGTGKKPEEMTDRIWQVRPYRVAPTDFAVSPCTSETRLDQPLSPCILVLAGGKRFVFGTPEAQSWLGIGYVDAAFLMSSRQASWGGIMGLRSHTWQNGRSDRLVVVAGDLQLETFQSLEQAQANSDALTQIASRNMLDFRKSGVIVKPVSGVSRRELVFDTGDVKAYARSKIDTYGDQLISYDVEYAGMRLRVQPCGMSVTADPADILILPTVDQQWVAEQFETARRDRLPANALSLRLMGELCPTGLKAAEQAKAMRATELVLWTDQMEAGLSDTEKSLFIHEISRQVPIRLKSGDDP